MDREREKGRRGRGYRRAVGEEIGVVREREREMGGEGKGKREYAYNMITDSTTKSQILIISVTPCATDPGRLTRILTFHTLTQS